MKLGTQKTLEQLKPVLISSKSTGPDPVYFVFQDIEHDKWANITIIQNGRIGIEYPKTFGHFHSKKVNETYHVLAGEGVMQLMRKSKEDPSKVEAVYLIKAKEGDEIVITPEYGHSWSNVGDFPLITFDNWTYGHEPADYDEIKKYHGLAYYLTEEGGKPKAIPNPNYRNSPNPVWMSVEEFAKLSAND